MHALEIDALLISLGALIQLLVIVIFTSGNRISFNPNSRKIGTFVAIAGLILIVIAGIHALPSAFRFAP